MTENKSGRVVRSKAKWAAIVEEQERSGESAAKFCREQSICYHHFLYRRKTFKKSNQSLTMAGSSQTASLSKGFIPIKVEEGASVRLRFPAGLVLESDRFPSAAWVVEVARRWVEVSLC